MLKNFKNRSESKVRHETSKSELHNSVSFVRAQLVTTKKKKNYGINNFLITKGFLENENT